jgi:lipopolysaccharide export system protein LptA
MRKRTGLSWGGMAVIALHLGLVGGAWAQEPATATGRLQGLSLSSGLPIQIESDRLEVLDGENKAIFDGNVNVSQGPTVLKAGKMVVFYAAQGEGSTTTGSSNIERLEVQDKVYIKSNTQVATGDSGVFDMATEVLTLSGKEVVLSEGENVLVGCKLTVNMKSGRAQVEGCTANGGTGRVMMSIQPGTQNSNP